MWEGSGCGTPEGLKVAACPSQSPQKLSENFSLLACGTLAAREHASTVRGRRRVTRRLVFTVGRWKGRAITILIVPCIDSFTYGHPLSFVERTTCTRMRHGAGRGSAEVVCCGSNPQEKLVTLVTVEQHYREKTKQAALAKNTVAC